MPTTLKKATEANDLKSIIELRRNFSINKKSFRTDEFDVYPETINLSISHNGLLFGTARSIKIDQSTKHFHKIYSYQESILNLKKATSGIDLVCLKESKWNLSFLYQAILKQFVFQHFYQQTSYLLVNIPTNCISALDNFEYSKLETNEISYGNFSFFPIILDVEKSYEKIIAHFQNQDILSLQENLKFKLFYPGEVLMYQGERGHCAYMIDQGDVEVYLDVGENFIQVASMSNGELIGEVAMLTNEKRSASIICQKPTIALTFERSSFMETLYQTPERIGEVFQIFSHRLAVANSQIIKLKEKVKMYEK